MCYFYTSPNNRVGGPLALECMEESTSLATRLVMVLALVITNGFFVATEFALVSVRRSRIEAMAKEGDRAAAQVLDALTHLDFYIAATQVGITIASLVLGWVGEHSLSEMFTRLFSFLPAPMAETVSHALAVPLAFVVMTFLHVVLGELVPKSVALQYPDDTSRLVAMPLRVVVVVLRPLIWALNGTGIWVLKMIGLPANSGHGAVHTVEELKVLMDDSARRGVLDSHEKDMVSRVFNLKELVVRQVMVHRLHMVAVEVGSTFADVQARLVEEPHQCLPVFEGDLDHVLGVLYMRDLLLLPDLGRGEFNLRVLVKPVLRVPETLPAGELLGQFRRERTEVALVLDEFGGTSGLVTLEDMAREVLGSLDDDPEEEVSNSGVPSERPAFLVMDGLTRLDELQEGYGLGVEDEDVDTLAGLVLKHLGRVAAVGDQVEVGGLRLTVLEMDGRRVAQLRVEALTPEQAELLGTLPLTHQEQ